MKESTRKFIIYLLLRDLEEEWYEGFLDNPQYLDTYTKDLIDATIDFIGKKGEWFDKVILDEELVKYKLKEGDY
jgi:hypothetical protein